MKSSLWLFGGAALGAVTMYYFDPDRGRGRRSTCENQWAARGRPAARNLDKAGRDLANRATGLVHEARHLMHGQREEGNGHRGLSWDILHDELAPGTRLLLAGVGSSLFVWGLLEKAPQACFLGSIGALLAVPAATGRGLGCDSGKETDRGPEASRQSQRPALRTKTDFRTGPVIGM